MRSEEDGFGYKDRVSPINYISDCSCQLFSLYFSPAFVCGKSRDNSAKQKQEIEGLYLTVASNKINDAWEIQR